MMKKFKVLLMVLFAGVLVAGVGFTLTACGEKIVSGIEYVENSMTGEGKVKVGRDPLATGVYNGLKIRVSYTNNKKIDTVAYPNRDITFEPVNTNVAVGSQIAVTVTYKLKFSAEIKLTVIEVPEILDYTNLQITNFALPESIQQWQATRNAAKMEQDDTEVVFMDKNQKYTVGHKGTFKLFPLVIIKQLDGQNPEKAEKFNTQYTFKVKNNAGVWETTSDEYFDDYNNLDGLFDFSELAIGKEFRAYLRLPTVTSAGTPVRLASWLEEDTYLTFDFIVQNGYNSYGLDGLMSLNNDHVMDYYWGATAIDRYKERIDDVEGLFMHDDVKIPVSAIPVNAYEGGISGNPRNLLAHSFVMFKYTDLNPAHSFTFNGNYFGVDGSEIPMQFQDHSLFFMGSGTLFVFNNVRHGADCPVHWQAEGEGEMLHGSIYIKNIRAVGNVRMVNRNDKDKDGKNKAADFVGGIAAFIAGGSVASVFENVVIKDTREAFTIVTCLNVQFLNGKNLIKNCRINNSFSSMGFTLGSRLTMVHTKSTAMGGAAFLTELDRGSEWGDSSVEEYTKCQLYNELNLDTYSLVNTMSSVDSGSAWFVLMGGPILGVINAKYGPELDKVGFSLTDADGKFKFSSMMQQSRDDIGRADGFVKVFANNDYDPVTFEPGASVTTLADFYNKSTSPAFPGYDAVYETVWENYDSGKKNQLKTFVSQMIQDQGMGYVNPGPSGNHFKALHKFVTEMFTNLSMMEQIQTELADYKKAMSGTKASGGKPAIEPRELTEDELDDLQNRLEMVAVMGASEFCYLYGLSSGVEGTEVFKADGVTPEMVYLKDAGNNNILSSAKPKFGEYAVNIKASTETAEYMVKQMQLVVADLINKLSGQLPLLRDTYLSREAETNETPSYISGGKGYISYFDTAVAEAMANMSLLAKNNITEHDGKYYFTMYLTFSGRPVMAVMQVFPK